MNAVILLNLLSLVLLAAAALTDLRTRRLPNAWVGAAALAALGAKALVWAGLGGPLPGGNHLLGLGVWAFLVALKLGTRLPLGAGDLKVLGVGALAAGYLGLAAMLVASLVWALGWLALGPGRDGSPTTTPRPRRWWARVRIPLGPGLAVGLLAAQLLQPGQLAAQDRPTPGPAEAFIDALEFRDQSLADIVRALGSASGQALVVDETVEGRGSWYFPKGRLSDAWAAFLARYRLVVRSEGALREVSRVDAGVLADGTVTCEAEDVALGPFLQVVARRLQKTILVPPLPTVRLTVHGFRGTLDDLLALAASQVPDYRLKKLPGYYTFTRADSAPAAGAPPPGLGLTRSGDLWNLEASRVAFTDIVRALAAQAGFEYTYLQRPDTVIDEARFSGKSLADLLDLLGQLAGTEAVLKDGIWYFTPRNSRDLAEELKVTEVAVLTHLAAADAANLMPPDLAAAGVYRIDKADNAFVLHGSPAQVASVKAFLASLDRPLEGRRWVRFDLASQRVKDVVAKFPAGTGPLAEAVVLAEQNALLVPVSAGSQAEVKSLITELDRPARLHSVVLRYLRAEDLLKRLPPTVAKDELIDGGGSLLLFSGPDERFDRLKADLEVLDKPRPQIRYQIMVVDYQKGQSLSLATSHRVGSASAGDETGALGQLAGLMNLSLDVVSNFGLSFASSLSLKLARSQAKVVADTTLQGLSGQDLKFQNTTTVRYLDTQIDPTTGKETATGITRDLSSGLILALNGWVSGDGIITVTVSATISKLGDSGTSSRPTTSERVLSTQVRTPSGTPLVIGGLQQKGSQQTRTGLPWLTDIPLVGALFDNRDDQKDTTELTIYVVPFVDYGLDKATETQRFLAEARDRLAPRLEAAWARRAGEAP